MRHTSTCSKHFVNTEGRSLYPGKVLSFTLPSNNRSLRNNWRKSPKYPFASLSNEPATVVVNIRFAHGAIEHWSTCASPEVPTAVHGLSWVANFPFSVRVGSSCFTPWKSMFFRRCVICLQKLHMSPRYLKEEQRLSAKAIFDGQDVFVWLSAGQANIICYQTLPFLVDLKCKCVVTGHHHHIKQASN